MEKREAPRCLSVFTSPPHQLIAREEVGEANSLVWEAGSWKDIMQTNDPCPTIPWWSYGYPLQTLVECGGSDDVMTNRATASVPLPAAASPHCLFPPLSQVISIQLGQTDLENLRENEGHCGASADLWRISSHEYNYIQYWTQPVQIYALVFSD